MGAMQCAPFRRAHLIFRNTLVLSKYTHLRCVQLQSALSSVHQEHVFGHSQVHTTEEHISKSACLKTQCVCLRRTACAQGAMRASSRGTMRAPRGPACTCTAPPRALRAWPRHTSCASCTPLCSVCEICYNCSACALNLQLQKDMRNRYVPESIKDSLNKKKRESNLDSKKKSQERREQKRSGKKVKICRD